jgi:hypothetical protein
MIPLFVAPTDIDTNPIAYIGDRKRLQRKTGLTHHQLEEIAEQEQVGVTHGYSGDYVFETEIGKTSKQAEESLLKLIKAYDYAAQEVLRRNQI